MTRTFLMLTLLALTSGYPHPAPAGVGLLPSFARLPGLDRRSPHNAPMIPRIRADVVAEASPQRSGSTDWAMFVPLTGRGRTAGARGTPVT